VCVLLNGGGRALAFVGLPRGGLTVAGAVGGDFAAGADQGVRHALAAGGVVAEAQLGLRAGVGLHCSRDRWGWDRRRRGAQSRRERRQFRKLRSLRSSPAARELVELGLEKVEEVRAHSGTHVAGDGVVELEPVHALLLLHEEDAAQGVGLVGDVFEVVVEEELVADLEGVGEEEVHVPALLRRAHHGHAEFAVGVDVEGDVLQVLHDLLVLCPAPWLAVGASESVAEGEHVAGGRGPRVVAGEVPEVEDEGWREADLAELVDPELQPGSPGRSCGAG
jgi:hypothetical protein